MQHGNSRTGLSCYKSTPPKFEEPQHQSHFAEQTMSAPVVRAKILSTFAVCTQQRTEDGWEQSQSKQKMSKLLYVITLKWLKHRFVKQLLGLRFTMV